MSRPLDHAEYIRLKYLDGGSGDSKDHEGKKKKRKAAKGVAQNMKIIDDDIDLNNIKVKEEDELAYAPKEEKPSIAAIIDERPNHLKRKDLDTNKWRTIEPVDSIVKQEPESPSRPESHSRRKETTKRMSPDSDASPPRASRVRHDSDSDLSPERKSKRHDSDSDLSPPRPSNARHHNDNQERTSHRKRRNSRDRDLSPPRRRDGKSKDNGNDSDHSPPRSRHRRDSRPDSSRKERRRHDSDNDLSPPRSSQRSSHRSSRRSRSPSDDRSRKKETLGGKVAGLSDARSVREEVKKLKERERELMQRTGDDSLGRNAKTVYRDRGTGHVRDTYAEAAVKIKPDKEEEERQAKYKDWSKGLKQREEQKIRAQEDMREMDKPLARYEDDEDRDKYLKERELEEDPMLQFIRKKKQKEVKAATSRGEVVLIKPKYSGPPAPLNRFQIQPGYRWDGVDRSNGFEKKLLDKRAEKIAIQEEAYRWGTEDM